MAAIPSHCPACGQLVEVPEHRAGGDWTCPSCQQPFRIAAAAATGPDLTEVAAPSARLCAICQSPLNLDESRTACPACGGEYHADCWQENNGCAVYGCSQVPTVEPRHALEVPASYWGQENKPCPVCGHEILAAAMRCRHCGTTFASARPEDAGEFQRRVTRQQRQPHIRRTVLWIFALSVVPCCAPVGAIWGACWYPSHREDIQAMPSIYPALCRLALVVGLGQCVAIGLMALLYATLRSS